MPEYEPEPGVLTIVLQRLCAALCDACCCVTSIVAKMTQNFNTKQQKCNRKYSTKEEGTYTEFLCTSLFYRKIAGL